jgi:hypothetical protein
MPNLDEMMCTLPEQIPAGPKKKRGLRADSPVHLKRLGSEKMADA